MTTVHVPTILKQVKNYKSIGSKLIFLDQIKNHPITPFIADAIAYYIDAARIGKITDKQMIKMIDGVCLEFAKRFGK